MHKVIKICCFCWGIKLRAFQPFAHLHPHHVFIILIMRRLSVAHMLVFQSQSHRIPKNQKKYKIFMDIKINLLILLILMIISWWWHKKRNSLMIFLLLLSSTHASNFSLPSAAATASASTSPSRHAINVFAAIPEQWVWMWRLRGEKIEKNISAFLNFWILLNSLMRLDCGCGLTRMAG